MGTAYIGCKQCVFIFGCINFTKVLIFNVLNSLRQCLMSDPSEVVICPQQLQIIEILPKEEKMEHQMLSVLLKICLNNDRENQLQCFFVF